MDSPPEFRAQHLRRLSWMPWLYPSLKPKHLGWAQPWQQEVQRKLTEQETVTLGEDCFIAPEAVLTTTTTAASSATRCWEALVCLAWDIRVPFKPHLPWARLRQAPGCAPVVAVCSERPRQPGRCACGYGALPSRLKSSPVMTE